MDYGSIRRIKKREKPRYGVSLRNLTSSFRLPGNHEKSLIFKRSGQAYILVGVLKYKSCTYFRSRRCYYEVSPSVKLIGFFGRSRTELCCFTAADLKSTRLNS